MATIGPVAIPPAGARFSNDRIKLKIGNTQLDYGVLFLTESSLGWKPNNRVESITIPWQKISLHAITGEPRSVYFMLDINLTWPGVYEGRVQNNGNGIAEDEDDEGHESDESETEMTELWLVPEDSSLVETMYNVMIDCQALNPDRDQLDSVSEDEDFMEAEDDENGVNVIENAALVEEVGQGDMRNLHIDDEDKFADAEEE